LKTELDWGAVPHASTINTLVSTLGCVFDGGEIGSTVRDRWE